MKFSNRVHFLPPSSLTEWFLVVMEMSLPSDPWQGRGGANSTFLYGFPVEQL